MTLDNSNRHRVSTSFTIIKIFIFLALLLVIANLINDILNKSITWKSFMPLAFGVLVLGGILYYASTRDIFEYDDVKNIVYVLNYRRQNEKEIPVEKIEKILYSAVGFGRGSHSYLIVYRDSHNLKHKIRLFPIPFKNDINTIIADTKLRNPDLVTRNWTFGVNELFD